MATGDREPTGPVDGRRLVDSAVQLLLSLVVMSARTAWEIVRGIASDGAPQEEAPEREPFGEPAEQPALEFLPDAVMALAIDLEHRAMQAASAVRPGTEP